MALKDKLEQVTGQASSVTSSARDNVRSGAESVTNRVRSVKILDGVINFVTGIASAFKKVGGDIFNRNTASHSVNGAKNVGRGVGAIGSFIGSVSQKGLKFLGNNARAHPYIAVAATLLLGGAYFKAWRNDRAAKQQAEQAPMPPQQQSGMYHSNATQADMMTGTPGHHMNRHAPSGPAMPGQRPMAGSGQHGQRY